MNRYVVSILMVVGLAACATTPPPSPEPFEAVQLDSSQFVSRVDTFAVVLDASSSMTERYNGMSKISRGKETISRINQTLPAIDATAAVVAFGSGSCLGNQYARILYGLAPYSPGEMAAGLDALTCAGGVSPMADGVGVGGQGLQRSSGKVALLIVSDAQNIKEEPVITAAQNLKNAMGDRLCIYTIQVGDDPSGSELMKNIADVGGCGFAVNADDIATPDAMADYVTRVFLAPVAEPEVVAAGPMDSDGDGVTDDRDQCPGTPKGARVNAVGCWVMSGDTVLFDFDSAVIKDTTLLDEAAAIMTNEQNLTGEIAGHTDSVGPEAYNQKLSEARANAVRDYFIRKGIAAERLRAVGYGESRPVAGNDTEEGRRQNRRVELHPDR